MIVRFLQAIIRFTYSFENLGMIATLKIIWFRTLKRNNIDIKISTKKFGEVFWNTKRDWVITHFYTPQIEIFSPNNKIKKVATTTSIVNCQKGEVILLKITFPICVNRITMAIFIKLLATKIVANNLLELDNNF